MACLLQEYVDLLIEEIGASVPVGCLPLKTLYFGGGTPSLIAPQQLDRLIKSVDRRFGIAAGAEISMEADPGTFDAERLRQYMSLGLTRFSIGVQAFQEVRTSFRATLKSEPTVCIHARQRQAASDSTGLQLILIMFPDVGMNTHQQPALLSFSTASLVSSDHTAKNGLVSKLA